MSWHPYSNKNESKPCQPSDCPEAAANPLPFILFHPFSSCLTEVLESDCKRIFCRNWLVGFLLGREEATPEGVECIRGRELIPSQKYLVPLEHQAADGVPVLSLLPASLRPPTTEESITNLSAIFAEVKLTLPSKNVHMLSLCSLTPTRMTFHSHKHAQTKKPTPSPAPHTNV